MFKPSEPACFGFLLPLASNGGEWVSVAQRPFRGSGLWLFGDATLLELKIGAENQAAVPLPFAALRRNPPPEVVSMLIEKGADRAHLVNASCQAELLVSPRLMLPTAAPGQFVGFKWSGAARGILLVGDQLL